MTENSARKRFLTTSQAARLLSVSPDTVLKWVKAGKLKSHRTLGGHFRIHIDELENLSSLDISEPGVSDRVFGHSAYQYCWEFQRAGGELKPECEACIAYRSRARRCYELRQLQEDSGCRGLFCEASCERCDFFRMMNGKGSNVLIFGELGKLLKDIAGLRDLKGMNVMFAGNEYSCALLIEDFRPDYIIIDCSLGSRRTKELCASFLGDERIPVTRIVLASRTSKLGRYCDKEVFAWIKKPFTIKQLKDCIEGVTHAG
ncbi:MAG: helix-turn-helix domain-containing protein [Pseudomonadota bacterium]